VFVLQVIHMVSPSLAVIEGLLVGQARFSMLRASTALARLEDP
jgi:hypothetical protein